MRAIASSICRAIVSWFSSMPLTALCAHPRQIRRLVRASMTSITSVPARTAASARHTRFRRIAALHVEPIDVQALADIRVVMQEQVRAFAGSRPLEAAQRHRFFHFAAEMVLEEWILLEPRSPAGNASAGPQS